MEKSRFRKVKRWFNRETFSCKECDADDEDIKWNHDKKVFYCAKCSHELKKKTELEEQLEVTEEIKYGFYLRFLGCHFNPCDTCQDTIHKMFTKPDRTKFGLHTHDCITMEFYKKNWQFGLGFFAEYSGMNFERATFRPCSKCQKTLDRLFIDRELHIGNEVKPPVELWRKWEIIC